MLKQAKEKFDENEKFDDKKNSDEKESGKSNIKSSTRTSTKINSKSKAPAKKTTTTSNSLKKSSTSKNSTENSTEKSTVKISKSNSAKVNNKSVVTKALKSSEKLESNSPKKTTSESITARNKYSKKNTTESKSTIKFAEYYDLPYKYGNTLIRLLAQTPKTLFVYWEVSDLDIENFRKNYGNNFFELTKPVIVVHNLTLNKSYEIEINDFANCWYINTEDSDCEFNIELGRRFINPISLPNSQPVDYVYIATSNNLQSPNDHVLFEKLKEFVIFKDVRNNTIIKKNIKSFKFLKDVYAFYQNMYDDEIVDNPSSKFGF